MHRLRHFTYTAGVRREVQLNNKKKHTRSYWPNRVSLEKSTRLQDTDWLKFYVVNTIVNKHLI